MRSRLVNWQPVLGLVTAVAMLAAFGAANAQANPTYPVSVWSETTGSHTAVALDPATGEMYTTDYIDDDLQAISLTDPSSMTTFDPTGESYDPTQLAVSPDGSLLYVTYPYAHQVDVVSVSGDAITNQHFDKTIATITTGAGYTLDEPEGLALSSDGDTLYISDAGTNEVYVADVGSGTDQYKLTGELNDTDPSGTGTDLFNPNQMALSPDGKTLYVAQVGYYLTVFDVSGDTSDPKNGDVLTTLPIGPDPGDYTSGLAVSPDGRTLYVSAAYTSTSPDIFNYINEGNTIYAVDVSGDSNNDTVVDTISDPADSVPIAYPEGMTFSADGSTLYVAGEFGPIWSVAIPPVTGSVSITGTASVGSTLTAEPSLPSGASTTSYQWFANGTKLAGQTGAALMLAAAQLHQPITVQVAVGGSGYLPTTFTSDPTADVAPGSLTTHIPKITGTATVGKKLTAVPGTWGPTGVKLSYQWLAGTSSISGATKSTYTPTKANVGKQIYVKVTGALSGYATASKLSAGTSKVTK